MNRSDQVSASNQGLNWAGSSCNFINLSFYNFNHVFIVCKLEQFFGIVVIIMSTIDQSMDTAAKLSTRDLIKYL